MSLVRIPVEEFIATSIRGSETIVNLQHLNRLIHKWLPQIQMHNYLPSSFTFVIKKKLNFEDWEKILIVKINPMMNHLVQLYLVLEDKNPVCSCVLRSTCMYTRTYWVA